MKPTTLRFFNELDEPALAETFSAVTRSQLNAVGAGVTLGLIEHSAARARVIRQLTDDSIPVGAWLLLPRTEGYFATHDNVFHAPSCRALGELRATARKGSKSPQPMLHAALRWRRSS